MLLELGKRRPVTEACSRSALISDQVDHAGRIRFRFQEEPLQAIPRGNAGPVPIVRPSKHPGCAQESTSIGVQYVVPEGPVDVAPDDNPTSEPEPDLTILKLPCSAYERANPGPSDVRLLVEISNSTLAFDLKIKAGLYARAGIAEYWVVDAGNHRILVHRNPEGGAYCDVKSYGHGDRVAPIAAPDSFLSVDEAFPARKA